MHTYRNLRKVHSGPLSDFWYDWWNLFNDALTEQHSESNDFSKFDYLLDLDPVCLFDHFGSYKYNPEDCEDILHDLLNTPFNQVRRVYSSSSLILAIWL